MVTQMGRAIRMNQETMCEEETVKGKGTY